MFRPSNCLLVLHYREWLRWGVEKLNWNEEHEREREGESQEAHHRRGTSWDTNLPRMIEDFITQTSEEIAREGIISFLKKSAE